MVECDNTDWWLWQMYRQVADFVHQPTAANEQRLRELLERYRQHRPLGQTGNLQDNQRYG